MEKKYQEAEIAITKANKEQEAQIRKQQQAEEARKAARAGMNGNNDMDMDGGANSQKKVKGQSKTTLSDFGAMGDLLDQIGTKMEKQAAHQQRMISSKAQKVSEVDKDKERLEKIGSLQAFQDNTLENLFLHVSNTVASKQT